MEVILITGLDGSGKSSVFKRLESSVTGSIGLLYVPHIKPDNLKPGSMLLKASLCVNELSREADRSGSVQLKSIALFSSMLLFRKIVEIYRASGHRRVYCERHPLIDTTVYATFYAGRLDPGSRDIALLESVDEKYRDELDYIISLIPGDFLKPGTGLSEQIIDLIYRVLHVNRQTDINSLKKLFGVTMPDRIYYLKAAPSLLFSRLSERENQEAHESLSVLKRLSGVYDEILAALDIPIEVIDTTREGATDELCELFIADE